MFFRYLPRHFDLPIAVQQGSLSHIKLNFDVAGVRDTLQILLTPDVSSFFEQSHDSHVIYPV